LLNFLTLWLTFHRWWPKSQFFRFRETCTWGHQRAVPP